MVKALGPPAATARRWWCRVYHLGKHVPDGITFRRYGPKARFDHHLPADPAVVDKTGRRVLYVGEDLATSACEVFGEAGVAAICPHGPDYPSDAALRAAELILRLTVSLLVAPTQYLPVETEEQAGWFASTYFVPLIDAAVNAGPPP
jgi:hypothetical protein